VPGGDSVTASFTPDVACDFIVTLEVTAASTLRKSDQTSKSITATAEAADTTAPVITLTGDATMTLTEGSTFTDPGATGSDDRDGDLPSERGVGGDSVDSGAPGTYVITYNVSDSSGNAATEVTRTVVVEEAATEERIWRITLYAPV